jgi:hypothetical protein
MNQEPNKDAEINTAVHLSLIEIVVGSIGHGFKIPFTGTMLSYYQLYLLLGMLIRLKQSTIKVFNTSVMVALLKTLAPMGKKITPMIAITVQGFLLWLGTIALGGGVVGMMFGSALFVCWSIIQSGIGFLLVFGFDFIKMIEFFQKEMSEYTSVNLYAVFLAYVVLKIILAQGLIAYLLRKNDQSGAWMLNEERMRRWQTRITVDQNPSKNLSAGRRALRDLVNPFFFFSLTLMVAFHLLQNSSTAQILWFICRTIAVGFLVFYLSRSEWVVRGLLRLFGKSRRFRTLLKKTRIVRKRLVNANAEST